MVTPKIGEDFFQFDEHIFQMGWNHQPGMLYSRDFMYVAIGYLTCCNVFLRPHESQNQKNDAAAHSRTYLKKRCALSDALLIYVDQRGKVDNLDRIRDPNCKSRLRFRRGESLPRSSGFEWSKDEVWVVFSSRRLYTPENYHEQWTKKTGCLRYIGDYTIQLCGDYTKQLWGSLWNNQYTLED